ncbi:MAG TPA: putative toxin-antitoxin system toxin component, PIN family [Verrucomicrobiae bacterium]
MKPFQVVLDTNVLVAAIRSPRGASYRVLQLVGDARWKMNLSPGLLFEYEEIARPLVKNFWPQPERLDDLLDYRVAIANRPKISYVWRPILRDADDDMVLELAIAARADCIVTHNVRDFVGAERFGVGVLTPAEFLRRLEARK